LYLTQGNFEQDSVRPDDLLVFKLEGIDLAAKDHNVYVKKFPLLSSIPEIGPA
jgi:hypothetical protein